MKFISVGVYEAMLSIL